MKFYWFIAVFLDDFIQQRASEIKIPLDVTLKSHWLFVDGVQPSIPENPIPKTHTPSYSSMRLTDGKCTLQMDGGPPPSPTLHKFDISARPIPQGLKPIVKHELSLEQQL